MNRLLMPIFVFAVGCVTGNGAFPTMISHGLGSKAPGDAFTIGENPFPSSMVSINRGRKLYLSNCQGCHGASGHGDGYDAKQFGIKPGNLAILAKEYPDYYLYRQIANGLEGMPSWRDSLKDSEIWDMVNYIKTMEP